MLKTIEIKRFKQIEHETIDLKKLNILVGSNNSGKSSFMQGIQFAVSICQTLEGAYNATLSADELMYTPIKDIYALASDWDLSQRRGININFTFEDDRRVPMSILKGRNKNISVKFAHTIDAPSQQILSNIEFPMAMYVPGLAGIAPYETYKTPSIVRKAAAKGDANNYFRNILFLLRGDDGLEDNSKWLSFLHDFNMMFPEYEIVVEFDKYVHEHINILIKQNGRGWIPIDAAGAGMIQAIQILAYANLYEPKILLLDEPDAHLHPNNQRQLIAIIKTIAYEKNIQIIIATHSRHMMDSFFGDEEVNIIWAQGGKFQCIEKSDKHFFEVLADIGAMDGIDKLLLRNKKCIVFTEDEITLPITCILEASGFNMEEVELWSYKGCTKIDSAITLSQFVHKHDESIQVVIHRDRDYMNEDEAIVFQNKINANNMECFLTDGVDAESHFVSVAHLMELFPTIEHAISCEIIDSAIMEQATKSIENFVGGKEDLLRKAGERANAVTIFQYANNNYNANPKRYMYGKIVANGIKKKLQQNGVRDNQIYKVSSAIRNEQLSEIAQRIWA